MEKYKENKDEELYDKYLSGDNQAFEEIYKRYINKIQYFIYNIIKDYQKAEDITQDVFMYVLKNKFKKEYSFKYYIYLIAKSRAINYINKENRRNKITEKYLENEYKDTEKDVIELLFKQEEKEELIKSIEMLEEKYKNAIYLNKIEGFSYKQVSDILDMPLANVKTNIHRAKKELRKILIKKGLIEMKKVSKVSLVILITGILLTGVVYAVVTIYQKNNKNHNITFNASYQSTLDENTINNIWIGTLDLAWKELAEKLGKKEINLEENIKMVNDLNESLFSKEMLSSEEYKIDVSRTVTGGYDIEATLNKNLNFLQKFDNFNDDYNYTFGKNEDSTEYIKYFGINNASNENLNENINVLFYNEVSNRAVNNDFAVALKTKEGDEIILYRTDENKSFKEYYEDIKKKTDSYQGSNVFEKSDELLVPYVRVNGMISYNELIGKEIKNTNKMYISKLIQNVNFSLNESGCNLQSTATMTTQYLSVGNRYFWFKDTFIIFMKEANSSMPYFALKVDNADILEKKEENDEPKILDYTEIDPEKYFVENGEYKFFEDEKYEYYYQTKKTELVQVFFKEDGKIMTAEEALKSGKISIELLDKYGVEYIKKEK